MGDEEKQAIETLKTIKRPTLATGFERQTNLLKAIETVLNLIEKQQAEIKDLKTRKERQLKRFAKYKENIENKHEEIYEDLVQELEKKDNYIKELEEKLSERNMEKR